MTKKDHKTVETNKHDLHEASQWLLFKYTPRTEGTIATGPRDQKEILQDRENAKKLGKQLLKASKRKRQKRIFPIEIHKDLVKWLGNLASVDLFFRRVAMKERDQWLPQAVPDLAYVCIAYSNTKRGRARLSKTKVYDKLYHGFHHSRWLAELEKRKREFNMVGSIATGFREKTP
jgi:hypothetical protein